MTNDEVSATQQTYERIAAVYARERQHREVVAGHAARFAALLPPGGLALDVGCGPGFDTAVLRAHRLRAVSLDYSLAMMRAGRSELGLRLDFVQADMRRLPIRGGVDGVWCCAALLHLPRADAPHTLRGFFRVLRPGGALYLSVKIGHGAAWTARSYGQDAPRFFTYWQPAALDAALHTAGFTVADGWENVAGPVPWIVRFARKDASR